MPKSVTTSAAAEVRRPKSLEMAIICIPGLWVVLNSFRPTVEIMAKPPVWVPEKLSLDHYRAMFGALGEGGVPVLQYFSNSLIISVTSTVIAILVGMAGGYAFARYRFKGKGAIFIGLMLTRAVPGVSLSLPLFIVMAKTGLIDTHMGLILVYVALNVPFKGIGVMRSRYDERPDNLNCLSKFL